MAEPIRNEDPSTSESTGFFNVESVLESLSTLHQYDFSEGAEHFEGEVTPEEAAYRIELQMQALDADIRRPDNTGPFFQGALHRFIEMDTQMAWQGCNFRRENRLPGIADQFKRARAHLVNADQAFYHDLDMLMNQPDAEELVAQLHEEMNVLEYIDQEGGLKDLDALPGIVAEMIHEDSGRGDQELLAHIHAFEDVAEMVAASYQLADVQQRPEVIAGALASLENGRRAAVFNYAQGLEYDAHSDGYGGFVDEQEMRRHRDARIESYSADSAGPRIEEAVRHLSYASGLDFDTVWERGIDDLQLMQDLDRLTARIGEYDAALAQYDADIEYIKAEMINKRREGLRGEDAEVARLLDIRDRLGEYAAETQRKLAFVKQIRSLRQLYDEEVARVPFTSLLPPDGIEEE